MDKYKCLQLVLLKCLNHNTPDFRIITQDIDQFHLILEDNEAKCIVNFDFAPENTCIKAEDFVNEGEFSLKKCLQMINLYKTPGTKTNYFIFTNRSMVNLKIFVPHSGKYNFLSFFTLYNVNLGDDTLNIFIDQVPFNLNVNIRETFNKFTSQFAINCLNPQVIIKQFYMYLRNNLVQNLTKENVRLMLLDLFMSRYKVDLSCTTQCQFTDLWSDITCDKLLVVVDSDCDTDAYLKNYTACIISKFSETYRNIWFKSQISLLVRAHSSEEFCDIINILKTFDAKLRVTILCNCSTNYGNVCDLKGDRIQSFLKCKINIQGRFNIHLKDFMEKSSLLKYTDIIRLITSNFTIDYCYKQLPPYFVERSFLKIIVRFEVLKVLKEELFVIKVKTGSGDLLLASLLNCDLSNIYIVENGEEQVIEKAKSESLPVHFVYFHGENWLEWIKSWGSTTNINNYSISEEIGITYNIANLITEKRNTHLLVIDQLMGRSSLLDCIALHLQDEWFITVHLDSDLCYYTSSNSKSSLDHLQHFYKPIDSSELCRTLFESFVHMKKFHILCDGYDQVPSSCLPNVIEIITRFQNEGYKIWLVVSRQNVSYLEKHLNTISTIVKPFNTEDQKYFLTNYLGHLSNSNTNLTEFVDAVLEVLCVEVDPLLQSPLFLRFIGNVYINELKYFLSTGVLRVQDNFDLLYFMEKFIAEYVNWLVEKYDHSDCELFMKSFPFLALQFIFDKNDLNCVNYNEYKHLQVLIKERILVEDGTEINFIHPIFANYFAAKWLYDNLRNSNHSVRAANLILYKRRFLDIDRYQGVFQMFDYMLAKGHLLHSALIKGKFNEIKPILNSQPSCFYETDAGGRNIVHIAALYGMVHANMRNNPPVNIEDDMVKIVQMSDLKPVESEDTLLGFSTLDYALGTGCLAVANAICEKASHLISNIYIAPSQLESYYEYCIRINEYKHLYKALLKYTICLKVTTKRFRQNMRVETIASKMDFTEMTTHSFRTYLKSFNTFVLNHLMETLELKKQDSKYYKNLHLAAAFGTKQNILDLLQEGAKINNLYNYSHTPLHAAVVHENINNIDTLLLAGAKINICDISGNTALHLACQYANTAIVKKLIRRDANIGIRNDEGDTPFHHALKHCKEENAELFLPDKHYELFLSPETNISFYHCLDINMQNNNGDTPLLLALQYGCSHIVRELLKHYANVNIVNHTKNSCLHYAIATGQYTTVSELIYYGVNINAFNENGDTPLLIALKNRHIRIAQLLIAKGAHVTNSNKSGTSCLHYAAKTGLNDLIETILNNGACINVQDIDDQTPLSKCIQKKRKNTCHYLLSKGANPDCLDKNGCNSLHHAAMQGLRKVTIDLLMLGCNPNLRNADGKTPLMVALTFEQVGIAKLLINSGADVTVVDNNGHSCLHLAVHISSINLVKEFLEIGLDVNKVDSEGNTPLIIAAHRNHNAVCKLLLSSGADIDIENRNGFSCIHYAVKNRLDDIIKDLISKGANLNKETLRGETPLLLYIQDRCSDSDISKLLIDNGADVSKLDHRFGNSCLHYAAGIGDDVVIEYLLTKEMNINLSNNNGDTALHLAVKEGYCDTIELLIANGADVNIRDNINGNTCLHSAVASGRDEVVTAVIKFDAEVNATNNGGETPISLAERLNYTSIIKILTQKASAINNYPFLFSAVRDGEINTVKQFSESFDINKQDANGNTPLLLAIENNQIGMADFLLSQDADVTITNHNGTTCLHNAANLGDIHIIEQLLKRGCAIDVINADGDVPLQLAFASRYIHVAKFLLQHNAKIDIVPSSNEKGSCLHCACEEGACGLVEEILRRNFCIDKLNKYGATPLLVAIKSKRRQIASYLIEQGADVDVESDSGLSCLLYACKNQFLEITDLIIGRGLDINKSNVTCNTPLSDAITGERHATAMLLISKGANVCAKRMGSYPLHLSAKNAMDDVVLAILDEGFDIDKIDDAGHTPLYYALSNNNFGTAQLLISKGANLHISNSTYLDLAIECGYEDLVVKLINDGVNIHYQNTNSSTPMTCAQNRSHVNIIKLLFSTIIAKGYKDDEFDYLHSAAQFGDNNIIMSLLRNGYDINKLNDNGETPLLLALNNENFNTAKLLVSEGADYYKIDVERITSYLHYFAQLGWNDLILKVIQEGCDVNSKTNNGETPLFFAVRHNNECTIRLLLRNGADLSITNNYGNTAFHYAIENNSTSALNALLENIDVHKFKNEISMAIFTSLDYSNFDLTAILVKYIVENLKRESGETMLQGCVRKQCYGLVLELLQKFGNINEPKSNGDTAILLAVLNGDEDMIKLLLEHGADHHVVNKSGNSCLHYGARNSEEILTLFLEIGGALDLKNVKGLTPLLFALEKKYTHSAQLLINYGANIQIEDLKGNNCLHYAARVGAEDLAKYLIESGLDISRKNDEGDDCLDIAISHGRIGIIKLLIGHGMDMYRNNRFGESCLLKAIEENNDKFVSELLENEVDVNIQCNRGYTPFTMALSNSNTNYAQILLMRNADVRLRNICCSNLHYAISQKVDVVEQLLDLGFNVDEQDVEGNTPLLLALESGTTEYVQILLKRGANIHITNNNGNSCLYYAIESLKEDVLLDFLNRGAEVNQQNVLGETPLLKALKHKKLQHTKVLLDNGADCNLYDNDGNSCLLYAAKFGFDELILDFISKGANINLETYRGVSPFLAAMENIRTSTAKLLIKNGVNVYCQTTYRKNWVSYMHLCNDELVNDYIEIVDMILAKGFDIDCRLSRSQPVLLIALNIKCRSMIDFLITKGANIHQTCYESGSSCLHYAAIAGYNDLVANFLDNGLNIDRENNSRETPLRLAFMNKHCSTVQLLLSRGASVDDHNFTQSYMHYAAELGDESIVHALINKGADSNRVNVNEQTPTMIALESENTNIVTLLQKTCSLKCIQNSFK